MKVLAFFALVFFTLVHGTVFAETYDAAGNYSCEAANPLWHYEGYRHADGAYLSMVYGHPNVREFSKYGMEGFYLPDGKQDYYPFLTAFDKEIICSPATVGDKYDAVLTWEAPSDGAVRVTGYARLIGNLQGTAAGGKRVKARLVRGGETLWSGELSGPEKKEFGVTAKVEQKDKIRLHIENAGDPSGNLTAVDMRVETAEK